MRSGASAPLSNLKIAFIWSLLFIGAIFQARFGVRGTNILVLVTLFDIILPILIVWGFASGWLVRPSTKLLAPALLFLGAGLLHSLLIYIFATDLNALWLLKNTIRLTTVLMHFVFLIVLFQRQELRNPPTIILLCFLVIASLLGVPVVLLQFFAPISEFFQFGKEVDGTSYMPFIQPFYISPTVHSVTLLGVLYLLARNYNWPDNSHHRLLLASAAILIAVVCLLLSSKASVAVAIILAAWFLFGRNLENTTLRGLICVVIAVLCFAVGLFVLTKASGYYAELATRIDSLSRSLDIRLQIWIFALDQAIQAFPAGKGFGQFAHLASRVPLFAAENHLSPHNSFLSVFLELGLLGLALIYAFFVTLYRGIIAGPSVLVPPLLLVVLTPLMLHDGHTIRILIVILALGTVQYYRPGVREAD